MKGTDSDLIKPSIETQLLHRLIMSNQWEQIARLFNHYTLPNDPGITKLLLVNIVHCSQFSLLALLTQFNIAQDKWHLTIHQDR